MTDWALAMNWRRELEALVEAVPPEQVPDLIGELARVVATALVAQMMAQPSNPDGRGGKAVEPDRLGGTDG